MIKLPPQAISRVYDYLNGENQLISVSYDCVYVEITVRQTKETCKSPERQFENSYEIDGSGQIISSRQWIPTQIEWIIVDVIQ